MENEELKDILLEKDDEAKGAKLKKLLMFIAALVILFLIIIVAMKLVNSNDSAQSQNEADSRLVLPPVPAEQPVDTQVPAQDTNSDVKKGDTQLFEQVPIVPENKQQDDFEDMIKKLKDKEGAKSAPKTEEPKEVVKAVEHPTEAPKKAETKVEAPAKKAETKSEAKAEKKAENKSASKSKENEFKFDVKIISVNNADIALTHLFEGEKITHKFDNLFVKVANLSSDFSKPFDAKVAMKSSQKLNLDVDSKIKIEPLDVSAKIKLNDTNLPKYFAYAKPFLEADLASGQMSADAQLHYAKDIKADAKVSIKDIRLNGKKAEKLIAFKSLDLEKISFAKNDLAISGVSLNSPFIKAHLSKERKFNLSQIVKEDKNKAKTEAKPESKKAASKKDDELKFSVKNFSLKNGEVDFSDASLFMPFATTISKLNGKLTDIDKKRPSSGEFQGVVGKNGFAQITAKLFPFELKQNTDIKLDFKDIDLTDITPYSGQFVGYKIKKGKLNLNLNYSVVDSKLNGSNFINFDSLTLGEKVESKDAVNLPLSLAISILSDQNNQINIDLPVEGNLDDPDFKYGGVIWAAVKKLFADITLAPFRFLGNALGLGSKDLSSIDFLAGSSELISSEAPKIADFIKLTGSKPKMKLSITPTYSKLDESFYKNKKLDQKINQIIASSSKDYIAVLNELVPNLKDRSEKALREEALKGIEVDKAKLIELANERANAVKEALIKAGLEAGRININDATSSEPKQNTYTSVLMGVAN